jgi:hypothetical protein
LSRIKLTTKRAYTRIVEEITINVLKINFGSKIGRTEYWARLAMTYVLIMFGIGLFIAYLSYFEMGGFGMYLLSGMMLYIVVYSWNNSLGRLRDVQKWPYIWMFLSVLPGINIIIAIIIGCFQTPNNEVPASLKDIIIVVVSFIFWLISVVAISAARTYLN